MDRHLLFYLKEHKKGWILYIFNRLGGLLSYLYLKSHNLKSQQRSKMYFLFFFLCIVEKHWSTLVRLAVFPHFHPCQCCIVKTFLRIQIELPRSFFLLSSFLPVRSEALGPSIRNVIRVDLYGMPFSYILFFPYSVFSLFRYLMILFSLSSPSRCSSKWWPWASGAKALTWRKRGTVSTVSSSSLGIFIYIIVQLLFLQFTGNCRAVEYCLDLENMNLSAIRTIRVLRPLRAINRIPSEWVVSNPLKDL